MKRLNLFIVIISLLASSILLGQLPTVVDNSQWFPPARHQYMNNCTSFSNFYYLLSAERNCVLKLDPKLEENQFSPLFPWNQMVDPVYQLAGWNEVNFDFLANQGAATIADFDYLGNDPNVLPNLNVRKSALKNRLRSNFVKFSINYSQDENNGIIIFDSVTIASKIDVLKDSLRQGKCFTVNFSLFEYFNDLNGQDTAVYSYIGEPWTNSKGGHMVAVTGYDDGIGEMGSFRCINSFGPAFGNQGYFYLDINWFFAGYGGNQQAAYFLPNEKFDYTPEVVMQLDLDGLINGVDRVLMNYPLVDTVFERESSPYRVDALSADFFSAMSHPNTLRLNKINGKVINAGHNYLYVNRNNNDGNYVVLFDMTDYVSADDFVSAELLMYDPISGIFIGNNDEVLYQYSREAVGSVVSGEIELQNGKRISVKAKAISDSSVTKQDYSSGNLSYHVIVPEGYVSVKSSTCTFKRWLITFNIADSVTGVEDDFNVPTEFSLSQNYPNPFNPSTAINFSIAERGFVTLKVFNLLGQEVATLVNEEKIAGHYNVNFNASQLASGMYVYRLQTENFTSTKKMILMK